MLDKITLQKLIEYNRIVKPLESENSKLLEDEGISEQRKSILLTTVFVKKAEATFNFFAQPKDKKSAGGKPSVDFLISWYKNFMDMFENFVPLNYKKLSLPEPKLLTLTPITFGQFYDAKTTVESGFKNQVDKWQIIQYIMAIFLGTSSKGFVYDETVTNEESNKFKRCGLMSLEIAISVNVWWETLNQYINENYTLFQETGDRHENTDNVDSHMEQWGWINFLKSLAKTKIFDIAGRGLNSIDCVRATRCSDVLVFASEEKGYNVATSRDMKSINK